MAKADVIAEIGIEVTEFRANMEKAVASVDKTTKATKELDKAAKAAGKAQEAAGKTAAAASSKGQQQAGQLAAQLQEVANQAGSGGDALSILAHKGAQLAGVAGPTAMLAGGVIAMGAAFASAAQDSEDAFNAIISGSHGVNVELSGISANGSLNAVVKGFEMSVDEVGKLNAEVESLGGFWRGIWEDTKYITSLGGFQNTEQKIAETAAEIAAIHEKDAALMARFEVVAAEAIKIANLRAAGESDTADELQRQLDLRQQLEGITGGKGSDESKVRQRDLARELAAAKEREIANKKADDEAKKSADEARQDADEEFRMMTEFYAEQEKDEAKANADFEKHSEARLKNLQEIDDFNADMRKRQEDADKEAQAAQDRLAATASKMLDEMRDEEIDAIDKRIAKQKKERETLADAAREALANQKKINDERDKYYAKGATAGRRFDRQQAKEAKELAVGARRRAVQDAKKAGRMQPVRGAAGFAPAQPMAQPNAPAAPANGGQGGAVAMMQVASLVVGELKSK